MPNTQYSQIFAGGERRTHSVSPFPRQLDAGLCKFCKFLWHSFAIFKIDLTFLQPSEIPEQPPMKVSGLQGPHTRQKGRTVLGLPRSQSRLMPMCLVSLAEKNGKGTPPPPFFGGDPSTSGDFSCGTMGTTSFVACPLRVFIGSKDRLVHGSAFRFFLG